MVVVRQVQPGDLDDLMQLAGMTGYGLTTLPRDRELLERRVRNAGKAFKRVPHDPPRGEKYLFVMEDLDSGKVIGTSGVVAKVGGFEPFYAFRIETVVHESQQLDVRKEIRVLHLVEEHNGPCEIGSLFLSPDHRQRGAGRLLSLSRFLFMAEHPTYFDQTVIAEMRGVIDERGQSDFWDALGKHFFEVDFPTADYLSMVDKQFIADLMPHHPIYITLLPDAARKVVGEVHEQTVPARRVLESEGFTFSGMVDIFEAGPVLTCPLPEIRAVRESINAPVSAITDSRIESEDVAIARTTGDFRACLGPVKWDADMRLLTIEKQTAETLQLVVGDPVRFVKLRAEKRPNG